MSSQSSNEKTKFRARSSLWPKIGLFRNDIFRTFTNLTYEDSSGFSCLNLWSNEKEVIILAQVKGFHLDKIDITLSNQTLILLTVCLPKDLGRPPRKSDFEAFTHTIELPTEIDANKIEADYRNDLLYIRLPHASSALPDQLSAPPVQ